VLEEEVVLELLEDTDEELLEADEEDDSDAEVEEEASELAVLDEAGVEDDCRLETVEDEAGVAVAEAEVELLEDVEEGMDPAPARPMGSGKSGKSMPCGERFLIRRLALRWAWSR